VRLLRRYRVGKVLELVHQVEEPVSAAIHSITSRESRAPATTGVAGGTSGDVKWGDPYPESTTRKRADAAYFSSPRAKGLDP
jgi:hypothetical protein